MYVDADVQEQCGIIYEYIQRGKSDFKNDAGKLSEM
jgi:hypothetical protein